MGNGTQKSTHLCEKVSRYPKLDSRIELSDLNWSRKKLLIAMQTAAFSMQWAVLDLNQRPPRCQSKNLCCKLVGSVGHFNYVGRKLVAVIAEKFHRFHTFEAVISTLPS